MNVFLSHINFMPLLYGLVLFVSTALIVRNVVRGQIARALSVGAVIWVGFEMHGHHVDSRMGVAIAALLLDLAWPIMFSKRA